MIVGSVCAFSSCCGVAVLTFLGMSRQLPVTTALHPASGETPNFCQSPLFFCAQRLDHFSDKLDNLRNSLMMLDVLASNRDLQSLVKENHDMFVDIEKTSLYQLGVERGVEQGLEQGSERRQQKIILNLLAKLTPEQVAEFSGVPLTEVNAIAKANKPN